MTHYISRDKEEQFRENVKCVVWGVCFVFAWLCLLVYGITWLSTAEKENTAFYGATHLEKRITDLENHTHPETNKGFTGKPTEKAPRD